MSQLPSLRRLPDHKKVLAKFKIHEVLFKAAHDMPDTQMYQGPAPAHPVPFHGMMVNQPAASSSMLEMTSFAGSDGTLNHMEVCNVRDGQDEKTYLN